MGEEVGTKKRVFFPQNYDVLCGLYSVIETRYEIKKRNWKDEIFDAHWNCFDKVNFLVWIINKFDNGNNLPIDIANTLPLYLTNN